VVIFSSKEVIKLDDFTIVQVGQRVRGGKYKCSNCGKEITISSGEKIARCPSCKSGTWIVLSSLDYESSLPHGVSKP